MLDILVYLGIFVIIIIVVWWLLQQVSLPEPLGKILTIAIVVIGACVLIGLMLHFTGVGPPLRLH